MATAKSEKAEIKRFGGKPQKNSGRGQFNKGDAILGNFTVDVKEYAKSYAISRANWSKISTDAAKNGNEPALMLCIGEGEKVVRLWVIGEGMFKEMYDAWEQVYGGQ